MMIIFTKCTGLHRSFIEEELVHSCRQEKDMHYALMKEQKCATKSKVKEEKAFIKENGQLL